MEDTNSISRMISICKFNIEHKKASLDQGVVHTVCLQDEVGKWSKNVYFLSMFMPYTENDAISRKKNFPKKVCIPKVCIQKVRKQLTVTYCAGKHGSDFKID